MLSKAEREWLGGCVALKKESLESIQRNINDYFGHKARVYRLRIRKKAKRMLEDLLLIAEYDQTRKAFPFPQIDFHGSMEPFYEKDLLEYKVTIDEYGDIELRNRKNL